MSLPSTIPDAHTATDLERRRSRRRFGILCVLGYVTLSWAVTYDMRGGESSAGFIYPLNTFSMYAPMPGEGRSHILVRDLQGKVYNVTDFRAFNCAEPLFGTQANCADRRGIEYHYRDLALYIETHKGAGDVPVEVINRTWTFRADGPTQTSDCVVSHCQVSR